MLLLVLVFVLPQRLRSFIVFVALMLLLVLVLPQRLRRLRSSHAPLRARACKAKPKGTLMRAMLPRDMAIACMRHAVLLNLVPLFWGVAAVPPLAQHLPDVPQQTPLALGNAGKRAMISMQ